MTLVSYNCFSQQLKEIGYRIEGDEIVFSFNRNDYNKITPDHEGVSQEFKDFNIKNVIVSGEFNNWTREDWVMVKLNNDIFELRKKISDFSDEFDWEFKFLINNYYWAEPEGNILNITPTNSSHGNLRHVYNLKVYTAYPNTKGNAPFRLKGFKNAKKVVLTGSFNKWDESLFLMNKTDNGWELTLQLNPNIYEYKFIVDGEWMHDPNNPSMKNNEFDGYNSVIDIKIPVGFNLVGHLTADQVYLSGSFNDWNTNKIKMTKTKKGWFCQLPLSGGKHHYKFIVDGVWVIDPNNSVKEYDQNGHINSVRMVKD